MLVGHSSYCVKMFYRILGVLTRCLAVIILLQTVRTYPTGAPPEGCRSMIPGHGVPPQTGTTNPYTVTTDKTVFSCPGDEIKVTVSGDVFRGFLCEPIPNTGNLVQDILDPVQKQNKCGQMASVTHVDNRLKSSISFLWKPQTVQTIYIACTVVQSKYYFWVNITSQPLKYVKMDCSPVAAEKEAPEQPEHAPPNDVKNVVENTDTGSGAIMETGPKKDGISKDSRTNSAVDSLPEKGGRSKDAVTRNRPEKGGKSKDVIRDLDTFDTTDTDGRGQGHRTSGYILTVLFMASFKMFL